MQKLLSIALAFALVCGLFLAMGQVIQPDGRELQRSDSGNTMDFIRVKRDESLNQKDRKKPEKKPPPKEPRPRKLKMLIVASWPVLVV